MGKDITIHWYEVLDSTNRLAREEAANSLDSTVWVADVQTAGRGQRGNTWTSDGGKNLTFSWLVKPANLSPARQFAISQATALGICAYLDDWGLSPQIKWPNDIYLGDLKICGILIEHSLTSERILSSVVGIGLNLAQVDFPASLPNPTSLLLALQEQGRALPALNPKEELPKLLTHLLHFREWIETEEGNERLDSLYHQRLYRLGQSADYLDRTVTPERRFRGRILGIDERSCLRVHDETCGQERVFSFQEIAYLR
jgi:BirA family biotin operon repressor/biotin-[acetyl-CoA-carboxylase] ligase